ncbi:MAG TPA: nucleotidyl transferase AbiEii/AbiGii toxin family protein, partial [Myxococcales bacterium]|nr:nucleotidyl transferase AbiEii/AbiGii toxin family protein [Myxococcales bacterium]
AYPIETHIAEKLHAYTMPRPRLNSRVRDLPDLAILASAQAMHATRLRTALEQTFGFRRTHDLPGKFPDPPPAWAGPYTAMADDDGLPWRTLAEVTAAARKFLDPVLASALDATWAPGTWTWGPVPPR